MVLTVSFVVSPESRALLPPSPAAIVTSLIPASGYQDATTSPSATGAFVSCACRVHRICCPTFSDDRETPLLPGRRRAENACDLPVVTSECVCDTLPRRANHFVARSRRDDFCQVRRHRSDCRLCPTSGTVAARRRNEAEGERRTMQPKCSSRSSRLAQRASSRTIRRCDRRSNRLATGQPEFSCTRL